MNAVIISSESRILLNEQILKIVKKSKNIVKFNLAECSMEDIINEAAYISLLDETKYIIVRNCDFFSTAKLKDNEGSLLQRYLANPNSNTILIFTTTKKLSEKNPLVITLKKENAVIEIPKMNEYELVKKVMNDLKKENYIISYDDSKDLVKNCLNNYDLIYNEIEKIKLYYQTPQEILSKDLKKLISKTEEDNAFRLINAIIQKDFNQIFSIFEDLKLFKEEPIMLISLLAREYRFMYIIKVNKEHNQQELCKLLGIQKWQYDKFAKNSYDYSLDELKNLLHELFVLDQKIKQGKIDKYLGFELFLLNLD